MTRPSIALDLDAHCESLAACRRCSGTTGAVPITSLARRPRAMLVGQAPGQTERHGGRPFAGKAGKTLFRWFDQAGIDETAAREWFYISAITRCYPGPHHAGRGDRVPGPREREHCASWLSSELGIIRPPLIVPVGRLAIDRFLGPRPLDEVVGREHSVTHDGGTSVVIPLPHPSGASSWVYAPGHRELLDRSLALIAAHVVRAAARSAA